MTKVPITITTHCNAETCGACRFMEGRIQAHGIGHWCGAYHQRLDAQYLGLTDFYKRCPQCIAEHGTGQPAKGEEVQE